MSQSTSEFKATLYITQQIKSSQQNLPSTYDKTDYSSKHKQHVKQHKLPRY